MIIVASNDPRILSVEVTDDLITAHLADGRTISVPLVWSWRLANATPEQRQHFELGQPVPGWHWLRRDAPVAPLSGQSGLEFSRPPYV